MGNLFFVRTISGISMKTLLAVAGDEHLSADDIGL